jgi:hypothetical protein
MLTVVLLAATNPDLLEAEHAFEAAQFERVLPALARARSAPLTERELARSYELEALVAAAYDDSPSELRAFSSLLALEPEYHLPPSAGPKMAEVFAQAQRLRAPATPVAAAVPVPSTEAADEEPPTTRAGWLISGSVVGALLPVRALGGELSVGHGVLSWLDLGGGVAVSATPGLVLLAALHPGTDWLLLPSLQLRGLAFWARGAVASGAGLAASLGLRLGPGRLFVTAGGELYAASSPFAGWAFVATFGYVLELGRGTRPR